MAHFDRPGGVPKYALPEAGWADLSLPLAGFGGYIATVNLPRRPIGAFSPPNTPEETANQLRNLRSRLKLVESMETVSAGATTTELVTQINTLLESLQKVTKGE